VAKGRFEIDSMYRKSGYYAVKVSVKEEPTTDGGVKLAFQIAEGSRVAIASIDIVGNKSFTDEQIVASMKAQPEGFWWFAPGAYDEREIDLDKRERLPKLYGGHGMIDFQVTGDTLIPDPTTGKATLQLTVEEGEIYQVGTLQILGNHRFSVEELMAGLPFGSAAAVGGGKDLGGVFDRNAWEAATEKLKDLYINNGYITSSVEAEQARRIRPDGKPVVDLRWRIQEGAPATINKINIVGNEITRERVLREAIVLLPGELFNKDRLLRSYQNLGNLNFFQQPMPSPDVAPAPNGVDVDITFRVEEKRTGNINFGASVGQGTGVGGFIGLEEPNLFGMGKRGRLQWQFGRNINDFSLSYTDPAIKDSRVSGTVSLYNSRQKYVIGDLGRRHQAGGSVQFGVPFMGSRYSRIFATYGLQKIKYSEGSLDLQARYRCSPCTRSTLGLSFMRDTRVGLPFPVAGSQVSVGLEQNGGPLGGDGNFQKIDLDTRWYTPIGRLGAGKAGSFGGGVQFTLGITAKSGFIFGDPASFFTELYSMGGVQYGIPLRGYDEFSITPNGFDATAVGTGASADGFGESYAAFTVELGARLSQSLYLNTFFDAGNVYRTVRQFDPTRLYRGAGVGVALISPLGPIGVDLGYGFDRRSRSGYPAPAWKLHFRLGNFF
jgi:outer membrane protein insertion porin family